MLFDEAGLGLLSLSWPFGLITRFVPTRRSCATWLQQAEVDVKDAQGIMRHSRASTTQDVYQQLVPESQQRAIQKLSAYVATGRSVQ